MQYGACELLSILLQHLGRAGRNLLTQAFGIAIIEKKHFIKLTAPVMQREENSGNRKRKKEILV